MLLKTLSGSRQVRIARNSIIIAALLATVFIRPESDFYSGMVAGARLGLIVLIMLIVTRRVGDRDNRL
jgi:Na+/proline symporter